MLWCITDFQEMDIEEGHGAQKGGFRGVPGVFGQDKSKFYIDWFVWKCTFGHSFWFSENSNIKVVKS